MNIASEIEKLMKGGYNKDAARAKVAHDIVLAAGEGGSRAKELCGRIA